MILKRIISVLICAAISASLSVSAVIADEPSAVSFNNRDDQADTLGDISEENAAFSNEGEAADPEEAPVDMGGQNDESGSGAETSTSLTLTNIADEHSSGNEAAAPITDPLYEMNKRLVNGSFEWPLITPEMLDEKNPGYKTARWFSATIEGYNNYLRNTKYDIDYSGLEFGWKTTAFNKTGDTKEYNVIELVSQVYHSSDKSVKDRFGNDVYYNEANGGGKVPVTQGKNLYSENFSADTSDGGIQCGELVGRDQSTLYQNVRTYDGETLEWNLSHRARQYKNVFNDTMALFIGPSIENGEYGDVDYTKPGLTDTNGFNYTSKDNPNYDMFIWMAELIYVETFINNNIMLFPPNDTYRLSDDFLTNTTDSSVEPQEYTIYADPRANQLVSKIKRNSATNNNDKYNYKDLFSLTPTENCTQEWKCWIMTDAGAWKHYNGSYTVPAGQNATTFAFTALTGSDSLKEGNNLDCIEFNTKFPLDVTATAGGSGTVSAPNAEDIAVTSGSAHHDLYWDGTEVTVSAAPDNDHVFLGMYVDGVFYDAAHQDITHMGDTYSKSVTIDAAKSVQLIFSAKSSVMYDPNGGTFRGSTGTSIIEMSATGDSGSYKTLSPDDTEAAEPIADDGATVFTGWYLARAGANGSVLKPGHTVEYVTEDELPAALGAIGQTTSNVSSPNEDKFIIKFALADSSSDEYQYYACLPAENGLTFLAQWKYKQLAYAMTKQRTDIGYSVSDTGGTVSCSITASDGTARTDGFGYNADTVTLDAEAKKGYTFMGWFTEPNGGDRISAGRTYTYSVFEPNTAYARFSANLQYPYLSFISEGRVDPNAALANTNFAFGSHIMAGDNNEVKILDLGNGGVNNYGNTISTGFIANTKFANDMTAQYCEWVITIPFDNVHDIYIKKADDNAEGLSSENDLEAGEENDEFIDSDLLTDLGVALDDTPIFSDSENVGRNKGSIYRVSSISNSYSDNTNAITIKLIDKLPVKITGAATVTYGLIIDNIYAPGAIATIDYPDEKPNYYLDISNDDDSDPQDSDGELTHSKSLEEYILHSGY